MCRINVLKKILQHTLKWLLLGLLMGTISGGIGALFAKAISLATAFRNSASYMIFLLPIAGIIIVSVYKMLKAEKMNTEYVIESINGQVKVSPRIIPAVFFSTVISHTFGASVGKEGAALQLGGGFAALFSRILKLDRNDAKILTASSMGGFFAALFGLPIGTCIFALEVAVVGKIYMRALLPTLISCFTATFISHLCGVQAERFNIPNVPSITLKSILGVIILSVLALAVSLAFCGLLSLGERFLPHVIKNAYLRIVAGSFLIISLTLLFNTNDYNGAGTHIIHRIMDGGSVSDYSFLIKIIFTVISVSCGFKGGEIVPTLFIGATFGFVIAPLLNLPLIFGAAVGMIALFCSATKCPLASLVIAFEMFSGKGILFFVICVLFSFLPVKKTGLYQSQKFVLNNPI